jgi:ribosomal protein L11 methyltransferase
MRRHLVPGWRFLAVFLREALEVLHLALQPVDLAAELDDDLIELADHSLQVGVPDLEVREPLVGGRVLGHLARIMRHARRAANPASTPAPRKKRSGRQTLFRLEVRVSADAADEVGAFLVASGAGGVEEQSSPRTARLFTYSADRRALERLAALATKELTRAGVGVKASVGPAKAGLASWETDWMRHLEPVRVSPSLTLVPTTGGEPEPGPGRVVRLEPAMAFGFGEHATTRMAAREIERLASSGKARAVLDVGTGSGVLAVVAAVCGSVRVVGVDLDEVAVKAARKNAALNGVGSRCRFSTSPVSRARGEFDVVVANVDLRTLLDLAAVLVRRVAPGGTLLLTGILAEHARELSAAYVALGLRRARPASTAKGRARAARFLEEDGWAALALTKPVSRGKAGT